MFRTREMAKTGAFLGVPKAPFLVASSTAPERNPSICRALRPWGLAGWWRRIGRHFSSGRQPRVASREVGPGARGDRHLSPLRNESGAGSVSMNSFAVARSLDFRGQQRAAERAIRLRIHNEEGPGENRSSAPIDVDGQSRPAGMECVAVLVHDVGVALASGSHGASPESRNERNGK